MKYRSEIDGLRAVAVVPVILFHAGLKVFSGGYIGVDVFFVISGFLITTLIINDLEKDRFSIINFYERRARRILPALFFMMSVVSLAAFILLPPIEMESYSKSIIAVSLFASNVLFWRESGYFAAAAEEKPLLHTWSLAVEEQYYFVFPIFLLLTWKYGRNNVFFITCILAGISLILCETGSRVYQTANFYLAPTRAWELLGGSIAAFIMTLRTIRQNNILSFVGLVAIAISIFAFNEQTPFPSVYALLPVGGTILVLMFSGNQTLVGKILSRRSFVGIGLISYSAYLWHQPLFAFARISDVDSIYTMLLLMLATMLLAYLSYKFIEAPFRKIAKTRQNRNIIFRSSLIASGVFVAFGFLGNSSAGFKNHFLDNRLNADQKTKYLTFEAESNYNMYNHMRNQNKCHFWSKNFEGLNSDIILDCKSNNEFSILVLGGSHAMNLFNILAASEANHTLIGVSQGYCRLSDWENYCQPDNYWNSIRTFEKAFDLIIYHQAGKVLEANEESWLQLEKNLLSLKQIANGKLVVWGPWIEGRTDFYDLVNGSKEEEISQQIRDIFESIDFKFNGILDKLEINYFSLLETFNPTLTDLVYKNCLLYRDHDHISRCGEKIIASKYGSLLSDNIRKEIVSQKQDSLNFHVD